MFNFKITNRLFVVFLLVFLVIGWKAKTAQTQSTGDKPVEQVRKNIQVIKGQTGEDTWLWERDNKKERLRGRDMMRMVLELNRTTFNREAVVTCYTCHRGSTRPERMTPLPPHDYFGEALKPQPKRTLPTAQEVIAKYLSAVGANRREVLSQAFVMRGTVERVERAKASGPTEIVFKQPGKVRIVETLTSGVVTRGWNGTTAWIQTSKGVQQVSGEGLKSLKSTPTTTIAADGLFSAIKIPDSLKLPDSLKPPDSSKIPDASIGARLVGVARINDRDTYQVVIQDSSTPSTPPTPSTQAQSTQSQSIQLFFDVENGLLLRRVNVTNTMLGPLTVQWDFSDYRDVSGLKLPFIIRTSDVSSFDTVLRRFSEIKIDSSVKEDAFDTPRAPSGP